MKYIGIVAGMIALIFTSCGGGNSVSSTASSYPSTTYYGNQEPYYNNYQNFGYPGYYPPTGKFGLYDPNQGYYLQGQVKDEEDYYIRSEEYIEDAKNF